MRRKIALGIVLALGVIVAGAVGAITVTTFNVLDLIGVASAPPNPTSGKGRLYYSTADSKFHCLTSGGANCLSGSGGGSSVGAFGDIQFSDGAGGFQNANGIFAGTFAKMGVTGGLTFTAVPSIVFSATQNNSSMSFASGTGGLSLNSTGVVASEGSALTYISDTGDITYTATAGNIALVASAGGISETATLIGRVAPSILDIVGSASAVTPGSVIQRVVTTTPDPILNTDRGNRVVYNSASPVTATLAQAGSSGFAGGYNVRLSNQNAGAVTVTPTTSLINGNATLVIQEGQDCFITPSSAGTDYAADCNEPQFTAGANVSLTRGVHSITIGLTGLSPAPQNLAQTTNLFACGYTQSSGAWATCQVTGNSVNAAASTPSFLLSGTPFTGGSGTTTTPLFYMNSGTAPTTWSTSGTIEGINAPSGFAGNLVDYHVNGGASLFSINSAGQASFVSEITLTAQISGTAAASTSPLLLNGTIFTGGSGTTTQPYAYLNFGTAPTTWSTSGTIFGINAPSGFAGNTIDIHVNGGGTIFNVNSTGQVTAAGSVLAAAGSAIGPNGRSLLRSAADGRIALNNNANGSNGLTRFVLGTEAATNPAACPLSTIWDVCDGAGTTTFGNTTLLSANGNKVFVTGNFTTAANTNLQTITGLTFNFPAVAHNWEYTCDLTYSQATANAAVAFGIQAATNNPTNIYSTGIEQITVGPPATIVTGTLATLATTTATNIVSGTPGATATNYTVHLAGMLELGASANAVNIMVSTATSGDAVTVLRGSSCRLF